mgnify:CR=1 FL=1
MSINFRFAKILAFYTNAFRRRPLVLNIEMTHLCNLECAYCGRVRDNVKGTLSAGKVRAAIDEVKAPIVYFTGGEPLLYSDELCELANYSLDKNKLVITVTNGILLPRVIKDFRIKDKEHFVFMFSIDGLEEEHEKIRGKGNFKKMVEAIMVARQHGFNNIWANFTIYKENMKDIEGVVEYFSPIFDRIHFNLGYNFLNTAYDFGAEIGKIADRARILKKTSNKIMNFYQYFEFWKHDHLHCTPWGTVTLDPQGWRSPCYFVDHGHYAKFKELMEKTDWAFFETRSAPECKFCRAHCGFEPSIASNKKLLIREILHRIF